MKSKKKQIVAMILAVIVVVVFFVWVLIPKREELIMTPSTHEQIVFLEVDNAKLDKDYEVEFAVYDKECSYVQICIKEPDELANSLRYQGDNITILVNGTKADVYDTIYYSTRWQKYVMYLLYDIEEGSTITFAYKGKVVEMY